MSTSAPPSRMSIGDSANQSTSGPTKVSSCCNISRHPPRRPRQVPRRSCSPIWMVGSGSTKSVLSSTRVISASTLGSMRSSIGLGYTPMNTIRPRNGSRTRPSLHLQLGERLVLLVGLAVEHPLVGPQQVERGEDHADRGDDRPPAGGEERADQDQELADEPVQAGHADRRQHDDHEAGGEDRRDLLDAVELGDLSGCGAARRSCRRGGTAHRCDTPWLIIWITPPDDRLGGERERAEHDEARGGRPTSRRRAA